MRSRIAVLQALLLAVAASRRSVAANDGLGADAPRNVVLSLADAAEKSWLSEPVALEVGRDYELSARVRTQSLRDATLAMESFPNGLRAPVVGGDREWTRVAVAFVATTASDRIRCDARGKGGSAAFEDVKVAPVAPTLLAPEAIERCGPGYRYEQAGWIVLHVEGEPYERGWQHGTLLAREIADFVRRSARTISTDSASDSWKQARVTSDALFMRGYCEELLLEMKGIADGAAAHGAKYEGRPIDLVDVVTLNAWAELMSLEGALANTPNGLEGRVFKDPYPKSAPPRVEKCSAFAATGPATRDGHIVFGHITMFGLYPSQQYNVMLDVQPSQGHRVLMQGFPAAIDSGMDYYLNDAGILITETTIDQGPFNPVGRPEADRIRRAAQYASSIDDVVSILLDHNNGLYANEWLIGDVKTDEIAMFELGTYKTKLWRSAKDEWPGGTKGFYWGCNNTKDPAVASEYVVDALAKPESQLFRPHDRDLKWLELFHHSEPATIDGAWGTRAFGTSPICGAPSVDGKVTTSEMARKMMTWACFGRPNGRLWEPTDAQRKRFNDIAPIVSGGWTLVRADPPLPAKSDATDAAHATPPFVPPWRGTITAASDADLWLAAGWPRAYRAIEAEKRAELAATQMKEAKDAPKDPKSTQPDDDRISTDPGAERARAAGTLRANWLAAIGRGPDRPLAELRFDYASDLWHQIAENKGALVLLELRRAIGDEPFFRAMNECGAKHAGRPLSTAEFRSCVEASCGKELGWFFDQWLTRTGLPSVALEDVKCAGGEGAFDVTATVRQKAPAYRLPLFVRLKGEKSVEEQTIWLEGERTPVQFHATMRPVELVVAPYAVAALANVASYHVGSYLDDLDHTFVVYGTAGDESANRDAAGRIHQHFLEGWWQKDLPVRRDSELTPEELAQNHLVLIGRPETNSVAAQLSSAFPIAFNGRTFTLNGKTCARSDQALVVAGTNPRNAARSLVLVAGLSPAATVAVAEQMPEDFGYVLFEAGRQKEKGYSNDPALSHRF